MQTHVFPLCLAFLIIGMCLAGRLDCQRSAGCSDRCDVRQIKKKNPAFADLKQPQLLVTVGNVFLLNFPSVLTNTLNVTDRWMFSYNRNGLLYSIWPYFFFEDIIGANVLRPCSLLFSSFWRKWGAPSKVYLFPSLTAKWFSSSWAESRVSLLLDHTFLWRLHCSKMDYSSFISLSVCLLPLSRVMASPPITYTWAKLGPK